MSNGLTLVSLLAGCFRGFFFSEQAWLTLLCLYVTVNTQPVSTPCWQEHSVWSVWRMHEQGTSICILAWVIAPYPGKWHLRIDVVAMKYVSLVQGCKSRSSGSNHLPYHNRHPVWAWGLQRLICMAFDANLTARGSNYWTTLRTNIYIRIWQFVLTGSTADFQTFFIYFAEVLQKLVKP